MISSDRIISFLANQAYDICCSSIYTIYNDLFNATFLPPAFHIASYIRKVYVFYPTLDGLCIPIQIYV